MRKSTLTPIFNWVGGKGRLIPKLMARVPEQYGRYFEPFIGGGAMLLALQPKVAFINDLNPEVMALYRTLQSKQETQKMLDTLTEYYAANSREYFYQIRDIDRELNLNELADPVRAARLLYILNMCFRGLYSVNLGLYKNAVKGGGVCVSAYRGDGKVIKPNEENILDVSKYLQHADIFMYNTDFTHCLLEAEKGDFVFLDPPYATRKRHDEISYTKRIFRWDDQKRLARIFRQLDRKGCKVMLTNSDLPEIIAMYQGFNITRVKLGSALAADYRRKENRYELIITNY